MQQGAGRKVNVYSTAEDEAIFENFWNISGRRDLATRLGRPLRGVTYRFYQILREKGMTPHDYLMLKAPERAALRSEVEVPKPWVWSKESDMKLWRMMRSGSSMDAISKAMDGPSRVECELRAKYLEKINRKENEALKLAGIREMGIAEEPLDAKVSEIISAPVKEEGFLAKSDAGNDGIFEMISSLPDRMKGFEERLRILESRGTGQAMEALDPDRLLSTLAKGILELQAGTSRKSVLEDRIAGIEKEMGEALERADREKGEALEWAAREVEETRREREELQQVYKDLDSVLHTFMNLSSVDKLRVLGDFSTRLCTTVDKFGMVVNTRTILG